MHLFSQRFSVKFVKLEKFDTKKVTITVSGDTEQIYLSYQETTLLRNLGFSSKLAPLPFVMF